jgi:tetratricopeptide (TPR) repeat protein
MPEPEPEPKPDNPYVGPRPFERDDKSRFFGRRNETSQLFSLITAQKALLVYAKSGAGKTSLINAKLIPWLQNEGFEVFGPTRVRYAAKDISLSDISNVYVFSALSGLLESGESPSGLVQTTFAKFLKRLPEDGKSPRVLIFDQFEELFTSLPGRWQDRKGFFEQLATALTDKDEGDPFLRAVFVMREDYIASLDPYVSLLPEKLRTRFRLERLGKKAALEAVVGPLEATTRHYGQGVAEKLVHDLQMTYAIDEKGEYTPIVGEFIEPVHLQIVCERLWDELPEEVEEITTEHLKTCGDVDTVLAEFYADVVSQAAIQTEISEARIRNWVESYLITREGTRDTVFRERDKTAGAPNVLPETLENLHLIRGELRGNTRWYELTHDRLITPIRRSNRLWFSEHIFQFVKKWLRQHKTLVSSIFAVGLVIIVSAIAYLYQVAKERDRTLAAKRGADELIGFMESDLWRDLATWGKTEMLRTVNRRVIAYYDTHPPQPGEFDALFTKANALRQKGVLDGSRGYLKEAEGEFSTALKILRAFPDEKKEEDEYKYTVCQLDDRIGAIHMAQGNLQAASQSYEDKLRIAKALAKQYPNDPDYARQLSAGYTAVGDVLFYQGNLTDAIDRYKASMRINQELRQKYPNDLSFQRALSGDYVNIGGVLNDQGHLSDALQSYQQGLTIANELIRKDPVNPYWQRAVTLGKSQIASILWKQGRLEAALKTYAEALEISEKVAAKEPENDWYQSNRSYSLGQVGRVLYDQGNFGEALDRYYRSSLSIMDQLVQKDSTNVYWQQDLASAYRRIGDVFLRQGNIPGALDSYDKGLPISQTLAKQDLTNAWWQSDLSDTVEKIGDVLLDQNKAEAALTSYNESLGMRQRLVRLDDSNASWKSNLSGSYDKIGKALQRRGDVSGALDNFRKGLSIREELAKLSSDNDNTMWQADLGYSYFHVGVTQSKVDLNSKEQGQAAMVKGRNILRQLKERKALTAEQQGWLAEIEAELGEPKKAK